MIVEGKGLCAPSPWRRKLERTELIMAIETATKIANFRSYRGSRQAWKRGLTGSLSIQGVASNIRADIAPYVLGVLGEIAVAVYFGVSIDDRLLRDGDGGEDILIATARTQIKTRNANTVHAATRFNLVRAVDAKGCDKLPRVPILIFCEFNTETWFVAILGWCRVSTVRELPRVKARKGDHLNVEVPDTLLEPISSLKALLYDAN